MKSVLLRYSSIFVANSVVKTKVTRYCSNLIRITRTDLKADLEVGLQRARCAPPCYSLAGSIRPQCCAGKGGWLRSNRNASKPPVVQHSAHPKKDPHANSSIRMNARKQLYMDASCTIYSNEYNLAASKYARNAFISHTLQQPVQDQHSKAQTCRRSMKSRDLFSFP